MDESALVRRAQRGGDGAFESLVRRHEDTIYRLAVRPMGRFPVRIEQGRVIVDTGPSKVVRRTVASVDDAVLPG